MAPARMSKAMEPTVVVVEASVAVAISVPTGTLMAPAIP